MAYSEEVREKTYIAYTQCRTVRGTARVMKIAEKTVKEWIEKYEWDKKLDHDKAIAACNPFADDPALVEFIAKFNIPAEDSEMLKQIKIVENICFACIRDEVPTNKIRLQPNSFKEATDVLRNCWRARQALLHPNLGGNKTGITVEGDAKFDFVSQAKENDEALTAARRQVVSRQTEDSE